MDKKQIIKEFLNDSNKSFLEVPDRINGTYKTIFYKVRFKNQFDYIYIIDYINETPNREKKPEFGGVVDIKTNILYFADYSLRRFFNYYDGIKYVEDLETITEKEISKNINTDIKKVVERMAENIADDMQADENDLHRITEETIFNYYNNKEIGRPYTVCQKDRAEFVDLLKYIANPADMVAEIINTNSDKITESVKRCKMMTRKAQEILKEIETDPSYKNLRLAKQIRESIPTDAKSVNLFYKLSNGETITTKYNAQEMNRLPYWSGEKMHFSSWNAEKQARDKIAAVDGRQFDDIYIKNIVKLTYKGKTIWSNPDNLAGV